MSSVKCERVETFLIREISDSCQNYDICHRDGVGIFIYICQNDDVTFRNELKHEKNVPFDRYNQ